MAGSINLTGTAPSSANAPIFMDIHNYNNIERKKIKLDFSYLTFTTDQTTYPFTSIVNATGITNINHTQLYLPYAASPKLVFVNNTEHSVYNFSNANLPLLAYDSGIYLSVRGAQFTFSVDDPSHMKLFDFSHSHFKMNGAIPHSGYVQAILNINGKTSSTGAHDVMKEVGFIHITDATWWATKTFANSPTLIDFSNSSFNFNGVSQNDDYTAKINIKNIVFWDEGTNTVAPAKAVFSHFSALNTNTPKIPSFYFNIEGADSLQFNSFTSTGNMTIFYYFGSYAVTPFSFFTGPGNPATDNINFSSSNPTSAELDLSVYTLGEDTTINYDHSITTAMNLSTLSGLTLYIYGTIEVTNSIPINTPMIHMPTGGSNNGYMTRVYLVAYKYSASGNRYLFHLTNYKANIVLGYTLHKNKPTYVIADSVATTLHEVYTHIFSSTTFYSNGDDTMTGVGLYSPNGKGTDFLVKFGPTNQVKNANDVISVWKPLINSRKIELCGYTNHLCDSL